MNIGGKLHIGKGAELRLVVAGYESCGRTRDAYAAAVGLPVTTLEYNRLRMGLPVLAMLRGGGVWCKALAGREGVTRPTEWVRLQLRIERRLQQGARRGLAAIRRGG